MSGQFKNTFSADLTKYMDRAKNRTNAFVREFTQDMAQEIVTNTPRDTGFAQNSWYAMLNNVTTYTPAPSGFDDSKGKATYPHSGVPFAAMAMTLDNAVAGDTVYLLNNCSYIHVLENGYGGRPARNFVKGALSRMDQIANDVLKRIGAE
jgi:hypothetical protein